MLVCSCGGKTADAVLALASPELAHLGGHTGDSLLQHNVAIVSGRSARSPPEGQAPCSKKTVSGQHAGLLTKIMRFYIVFLSKKLAAQAN